ncbi:MAG: glycosyltransferase family 39 protein, partial [Candidatus Sulfotelmatobacter sp.]
MIPAGKRQSQIELRQESLLPLLVLAAGLLARLYEAWAYFLNPDEALHNLLASQTSLALSYKAALTNAHPPLLILVLYYWRSLEQSELMLRMPSVLAGTACCWIAYRWLKLVTDRSTAFIGLLLFAFSPALIELSAEVRQYALLLFFMSSCLYLSERSLRENSSFLMALFSLSLCGALLTHYSALIFAFTLGVYMLVRLYPYRERIRLIATWAAGQIAALALASYFLITHVAELKRRGMAEGIAETWLRKSIFHAGENHALVFIATQTLRVFTYLLSHGVGGTLALLAFLVGIISLLRWKRASGEERPSPRELALLLGLSFVVNCGAALAGLYPYGGTRHNSFLALFALSGTAVGLSLWKPAREWVKPLIIILCLAVCNFFPAPPPLIRPRNHHRVLMEQAMNYLRQSAPPGSIVLT